MPHLIETRGPIIRRFIWWKLRYEMGRWIALAAAGKTGAFAHQFWENDDEKIETVLPFDQLPVCGCDSGKGDPPTKLQMLECRARGGPCRGSTDPHHPSNIPASDA